MSRVMKPFTKYERLGAYHWDWYKNNTYGYKEHVDKVVGYFRGCSGSILDMGCGDALIASKLCDIGLSVVGVDSNATAVALGEEKCKKYIARGDMTLLNKSLFDLNKSKKYDYVLCNEVIEHVPEPVRCIRKIAILMNKYAIITTPNSKYHTIGEYDYNMWDTESIFGIFKGYEDKVCFLERESNLHIKFSKV